MHVRVQPFTLNIQIIVFKGSNPQSPEQVEKPIILIKKVENAKLSLRGCTAFFIHLSVILFKKINDKKKCAPKTLSVDQKRKGWAKKIS